MDKKETYYILVQTKYIDDEYNVKQKIKPIYKHFGYMSEVADILSVIKKYYCEPEKNYLLNSQTFIISTAEYLTKGDGVKIQELNNKECNMKDIEISRDKKNPTWAWVGENKEQVKNKSRKRIIIDICGEGAVCVNASDEEEYIANKGYSTALYEHYEIIKEPTYRPIETLEDYIEATKDRKDFRAINIQEKRIYDLSAFKEETFGISFFYVHGYCLTSVNAFNAYVWLDDRSPVGVKCS